MRRACVLFLLAACAKAPPPKKVVDAPPPTPKEQVKKLLADAYGALSAADADKLQGLLDKDVVAFGLAPSELSTGRDALVDRLRQQLLPVGLRGDSVRFVRTQPQVALAEGGASAWLWDLPTVEYEKRGKTSTWLPRVTAHAVKEYDAWALDAVHVSLGVPDAQVWEPGATRTLVSPSDVPDARGEGAEQLVGLARRLVEDYGVRVERASESDAFVFVGSDSTELFVGGRRFKELLKPNLGAIRRSGYSTRIDGGLRARLAPGGKSGWVAANVVLRRKQGKKEQQATPFRALWIFVEEQGAWNLAAEHQSLALKEEQREAATEEQEKAVKALLEVSAPKPPAEEGKEPPKEPKRRGGKKDDELKAW